MISRIVSIFDLARIKLTLWYLLIIFFICLLFSALIYRFTALELERFARAQRQQFLQDLRNGVRTPLAMPLINPDIVEETKHRVLFTLVTIDGAILLLSGWLGYLLAGRTLRPIQLMVNEQNRFISDASHELRTPLTALKAALEVHQRDKYLTLKEARALITDSIEDVNALQALSDGMLQLARIDKPEKYKLFTSLSSNDFILKAIRKIEPLAQKKHIKISHSLVDSDVYGERESLIQLMVIFLDNAIKYSTAQSSIEVVSLIQGKFILIKITDHGVGIQPADLPHIFDRFYRANSARTREVQGGYGLGLSIAQKIVRDHAGEVDVISELGKGSTFSIRLPLVGKRK